MQFSKANGANIGIERIREPSHPHIQIISPTHSPLGELGGGGGGLLYMWNLCIVNGAQEEIVQQKINELRIFVERTFNTAEKAGTDYAAATPHQRNGPIVQLPLELPTGLG